MKTQGRIHIVDDEPIIHEVLVDLLSPEGYQLEISSSGEEALEKHQSQSFDLILLDLLMPGLNGLEVLKEIIKLDPLAVVIIITAYGSIQSAIEAMKNGAFDYIQKPFKHEELLLAIKRGIRHRRLQEENLRLKTELHRKYDFERIIGKSKAMAKVFDLIKAAAPTRSTILIQGESGTGKELVARAIHQTSDRGDQPFIVVNSGSLPPDLLESHLFGHVKGAFTGAVTEKKGLFEAAHRGTIFFDEISSLNLETQAKLLRVMQNREFMRLGGTETIRVDVRVIAATNTDLETLIHQKKFREDLYFRLNVIKIELPPLRERKEDIPLLVHHFLKVYSEENNKEILGIKDDVWEVLENYDWPGNVRELENAIERAVVLTQSKIITKDLLPPAILRKPSPDKISQDQPELGLKELLENYQKKVITDALRQANGIQKKAAELLKIKPTTLNAMIKRLNINPHNY